MSWLRRLVGLLVASTALFAVCVIAERSGSDPHVGSAAAAAQETAVEAMGETEGTNDESREPRGSEGDAVPARSTFATARRRR